MIPYNIDLSVPVLIVLGAAMLLLYQAAWKSYLRTEHLRVAIRASQDFYDRAELILSSPETPAVLRNMIRDINVAVTDERSGEKAMELILASLADIKHKGRIIGPRHEFLDALNSLRRSNGDLYDAFHEAIGAAFAAIVLAHGPRLRRSKMALSYDAGGTNRSKMLSLAETLDAAISGWPRQVYN